MPVSMKTLPLLATLLLVVPLQVQAQEKPAEKQPAKVAKPTKNDWSRSARTALRGKPRTDKRRHGGAAYSRLSERGLDWLVRHQQEDGSWSTQRLPEACAKSNRKTGCDEPEQPPEYAGLALDVGLTGLALLAFTGRGNTYLEAEDKKFEEAIDRAVHWLAGKQIGGEEEKFRGFLGREKDRKSTEDVTMYGHAIATLALCELLIGTGDQERLGAITQAAVDWCLRAQSPGFGWHYGYSDGRNATPTTTWLSNAILIGEECAKAGLIEIPLERFETSRQGTLAWLDAATSASYRITGYAAPGDPGSQLAWHGFEDYPFSKAMSTNSACALFYRTLERAGPRTAKTGASEEEVAEVANAQKKWAAIRKAQLTLLLDNPPQWQNRKGKRRSKINFYYWAFASQAIALADEKGWLSWRKDLERQLSKNQESTGCSKGSWDPIGEWGVVGGRVYSTAMAVLALESSYRYQTVTAPAKD